MRLFVYHYHQQKKGSSEKEYEDAYSFSQGVSHRPLIADSFTVAMADGASESSFAKEWAKILVKDFAQNPPVDSDDLKNRSKLLSITWQNEIRPLCSDWFTEQKAAQGAFASLLSFTIKKNPSGGFSWRAVAVGDTCLFHIHRGDLVNSFPLEKPEDFSLSPCLLSSDETSNRRVFQENKVKILEGDCDKRDRFFLCTDAIAAFFLKHESQNRSFPSLFWSWLQSKKEHELRSIIDQKREADLKNDDVTIVSLKVE